jgi:hypothetical protein
MKFKDTKGFPIVIAILFIGSMATGQSIWKGLPPYKAAVSMNPYSRAIVGPNDSVPSISTNKWEGFRWAGPDIMFAIPDFSMWTGLGIDFVWAKANTSTGKWNYQYTVGIRATGGANLGSPTIKTLGGFGIRATFFNGLLAVGGIYNLTQKKTQAAIGNPAAFIPGLN